MKVKKQIILLLYTLSTIIVLLLTVCILGLPSSDSLLGFIVITDNFSFRHHRTGTHERVLCGKESLQRNRYIRKLCDSLESATCVPESRSRMVLF